MIWAGAVYSYDDLMKYAIDDPSFDRSRSQESNILRRSRQIRDFYGEPNTEIPYWQAVSMTEHLALLQAPLQLHHALNDDVVNIGYSIDLAARLGEENKVHEFYQYEGGGHNINSPYFGEAMQRTVEFLRKYL